MLTRLLAQVSVTTETHGYGESCPRVPDLDPQGNPIPENRQRHRRARSAVGVARSVSVPA